ncbi:MAG: hypothetical protein IJM76_02930 [Lachnospiraceae bacterium]|nr:hypothetical protein [Lachnospiraceae bacterium]
MALVTINFESQYLGNNHNVGIILPDRPRQLPAAEYYASGKKYPVLWLLHGTLGDYSDWLRKSMIELYASERDVIVVMPSALNSNYANWPEFLTGYNFYDYFFEELMPLVYNWFPASDKREDNFVAGLSMGGRGTCVLALNRPDRFGAMSALSGFPRDFHELKEEGGPMWERMKKSAVNFKDEAEFLDSYQNTWKVLADAVKNGVDLPRLQFGCGEDDGLYPAFLHFKERAEKELQLDADFFSIPGYKHEWRFWDIGIQKAMDFFGLKKKD